MKNSKNLSRNPLKFIALVVLSSISLNAFTANAQTDSKVIDTCKAVPIKVESDKIAKAYYDALTDSVKTEPDEIKKNLTIINNPESNPNLYLDKQGRVLVVTFTNTTKDPHFTDNAPPNYDLSNSIGRWVTVAPKLKSFCTCYRKQIENIKTTTTTTTPEDLNLRIEQLLGIKPNSGYTHIVELWVDPTFLHRPNNSVNISKSEKEGFVSWLKDNPWKYQTELVRDLQQGKSSSELATKRYPWTGLGYSFDWASKLNPSIEEFGLSEFVIWGTKDQIPSPGKTPPVEVNRVFTTEQYCK